MLLLLALEGRDVSVQHNKKRACLAHYSPSIIAVWEPHLFSSFMLICSFKIFIMHVIHPVTLTPQLSLPPKSPSHVISWDCFCFFFFCDPLAFIRATHEPGHKAIYWSMSDYIPEHSDFLSSNSSQLLSFAWVEQGTVSASPSNSDYLLVQATTWVAASWVLWPCHAIGYHFTVLLLALSSFILAPSHLHKVMVSTETHIQSKCWEKKMPDEHSALSRTDICSRPTNTTEKRMERI